MLMKDIQTKQTSLEHKLSSLKLVLSVQNDSEQNFEKFRNIIKEYSDVSELTLTILNRLIKQIKVGHLDANKEQDIHILWKWNS